MWNPASIADMMRDDLDVTEVVVLDHITAILFVGWWSAGEGLTEEEAQTCIDHFSPYIGWRDVVIECKFQALTLAEAWEEIQAYETWSHKSLWGWGWPKAMKPQSLRFIKMPIGLDCSPQEFQRRKKENWWTNPYNDHYDETPGWAALDKNNSALSQLLPRRPKWNSRQRQDVDQSGYYSEDSEFNSVSMTLVTTSEAGTARKGQNREQEGTFNHCLNQKIMLLKLNDDSSTNDLWIWLADAYR